MNLLTQLLRDEHGFVLSAESVLLGTVGVVGATVGLSAVAKSVNEELTDAAMAFRSLDQSFHFAGASGCGSCVAGSSFTQRPVAESLKQLNDEIEKAKAHEPKRLDESGVVEGEQTLDKDGDPQPPNSEKPHERRKKHKKHKDRDEDDQDDDAQDMDDQDMDDQDMDETSVQRAPNRSV